MDEEIVSETAVNPENGIDDHDLANRAILVGDSN